MIKKILEISLRTSLIFSFLFLYFVGPFTIADAAKASTATTIRELKAELESLKKEKAQAETEKAQTQSEINSKKNSVNSAYAQKNEVTAQIAQAEIDIENSNKEIERVTEEINQILRLLQISEGENAYLELISNAKNMTEMIYYAAITEQMTQNNKEQLDKLDELIKYNEQLKIDLAAKKVELDNTIASLSTAISSLGSKLSEISDWNADINEQIKNQNELIKVYSQYCTSEDQKLTSCISVGYAAGWLKPVTKGYLSSMAGYRTSPTSGAYSFHNAHDIAGNAEGTPVYASAIGMVAGITVRSSCGGNIVYIHHNVGGKNYTTHYAHLLSISSNIKVGTMVTANTQIGTVGGSSTRSYDGCTTGAHLHYGVANGHYLGGGKDGYSKWATFLANTITPPGFPNKTKLWWYTR